MKYLWWPHRVYIKTPKNGDSCEELLRENDFDAVLATFCCYDHGANSSEAVQKITTDQKEYRKCSLSVIICWIAKIYLSINKSEKWLVTRMPLTYLRKLQKLHSKKSNNWPMVSFIHNGSEITTWMRYSFKTKSAKSKSTFLRWEHLFWISSCRSLDKHKGTGAVRQLSKTYFYSYPCEKTYLTVHFTKWCFFVNLLSKKLWV